MADDMSWRGLDYAEIALMKRMKSMEMPRDQIMSFFVRPGRVISSAAPYELDEKRPLIEQATETEIEAFIARRMKETVIEVEAHGLSPVSTIRVREILQFSQIGEGVLPGFESHRIELKEELPIGREPKAKLCKTIVAFANHNGGYIFLGITDLGVVVGIDESRVESFWDDLAVVLTQYFSPFFPWERNVVQIHGKNVGVIYVSPAPEPPIIATKDSVHINEGTVYFRYSRTTEPIKAVDFLQLLRERDRKITSRTAPPKPPDMASV